MQMATEHPFKVFPGTINDPSVFPWPPGWHREIWCLEIVRQVTTNMVKILHESILAGIPTNQKWCDLWMICAGSTNHFEHLIFTCRQNFIHVQLFNMCSIAAAFFPAQIRRLSKTRNSETWRARREVGFLGTWSFPGCEPKWPLRSPEYLLGLEDPQRIRSLKWLVLGGEKLHLKK